jgi:CBS domain-containing protein
MIRAKNMMTSEVITVSPNSSILEAARLLNSKSVSSLVVIDKGKAVSVISEKDIILAAVSKKKKVGEVMNKNFLIIPPETSFDDISDKLREKKIQRFPVVDNGKIVGIITESDFVEATRDFTRMHRIVQDIILAIFGLATAFFLFYFSPIWPLIFG